METVTQWGRKDAIWFNEHAPARGPIPIASGPGVSGGEPSAPAADATAPAHYKGLARCECGRALEPWPLCEVIGFNLGNVVKYVARAGRKGSRLEDLLKAARYLEREIARERNLGKP